MSTPAFAILRTQKLNNFGSIKRSLQHSFREQQTPNANEELTPHNSHLRAVSSSEVLTAMQALLPEKRRKDAVLCIEYLVTASPQALKAKSREEQDAYFESALQWLQQRHGDKHVVHAGIHRDEQTPHLYAYVVPIDPDTGRLNAKKWLGGVRALNNLQTEFAEQVAKHHGLERGLERSRARHQTVKEFYGRLEQGIPQTICIKPETVEPKVLKKGFFTNEIESSEMVAERLSQAIKEIYTPIAQIAAVALQERGHFQRLQQMTSQQQKRLHELEKAVNGLNSQQQLQVKRLIEQFQQENEQKISKQRQKTIGYKSQRSL